MARRSLASWFLFLIGYASTLAVDLPEPLRKDIDKKVGEYSEACISAEKKLLDAFDAEKELIRKQPGLKAEAKVTAIEALGVERDTFETHGTIPFSPRMRPAAMNYLKTIQQAAKPASTAYSNAIEALTKSRDDAAAILLVAERKKVLKPKLVGMILCNIGGTDYTSTFYADGTDGTAKNSWTLEKDKMIHKQYGPGSPPEGWINTCIFGSTGQSWTAKNQKGGSFTGKRIDPKKE